MPSDVLACHYRDTYASRCDEDRSRFKVVFSRAVAIANDENDLINMELIRQALFFSFVFNKGT